LLNTGVLGDIPDNLKPALSIAAKNGQRLANLIDDLLDLAEDRGRRDGVSFRDESMLASW
jgi:signal transduction histidine kinase